MSQYFLKPLLKIYFQIKKINEAVKKARVASGINTILCYWAVESRLSKFHLLSLQTNLFIDSFFEADGASSHFSLPFNESLVVDRLNLRDLFSQSSQF